MPRRSFVLEVRRTLTRRPPVPQTRQPGQARPLAGPCSPARSPSPITSDADEAAIRIGDAVIRPENAPVYVIAEAGVNHNGDLRNALAMVDAAAAAGANAVKFQAFRASALVTADAATAEYQREQAHARTQLEMLRALELPFEAFASIARHCEKCGVEFLATPFGVDELRMLIDLGARAIKIASPDLTNTPLLIAAAQTRLPIIVSTGAAEPEEIDSAVELLDRRGARNRIVLLHCVSSYPAAAADANLRRIRTLAVRYGRPVGFQRPYDLDRDRRLAAAAGAVVIEKHFTLDHGQEGPDQAFSLEPGQLAEYVAAIRRAEPMLGRGRLGLLDAEREVRNLARCSVVAAAFIGKGERIERDRLTVKRPGTGIPPMNLDGVAGRVAAVDIPADTVMQWGMLQ